MFQAEVDYFSSNKTGLCLVLSFFLMTKGVVWKAEERIDVRSSFCSAKDKRHNTRRNEPTLSPQNIFFEIAALSGYIILAAEALLCASDHIRKTVKIRNGSVYSFVFLHRVLHSHSLTACSISRVTLDLIMEIPKSFIRTQLLGVAVLKSKHSYQFSEQPFHGY